MTDWSPLWLSLRVAAWACLLGSILSLGTALAVRRLRPSWQSTIDSLFTLPLVLPPTVLGYYLLVLLSRESRLGRIWESIFGQPLVFTETAAIVAALLHATPLLYRMLRGAFDQLDPACEQAARSLGLPEWRVLSQIVLPMIRRPLLAAISLAFARSLGDFGITYMVAGNIPGRTQTMALAIYDMVEAGNATAAGVMVLLLSLFALLVLWLVARLTPLPVWR
jgi:molybdate transport system permease protein